MSKKNTYYDVLEISENASEEDIKQAYRNLIKIWHPDLHPGDENAAIKTRAINEAYEVLSDPIKKASYDSYLASRKAFVPNDESDGDSMEYSDDVHYEEMTYYEYTENVAAETYAAYRDAKNKSSHNTDNDSSVTWRIPEKDELKQLRKTMFAKTVRVIMSSLFLSCYLILTVWIRKLELDSAITVLLTVAAALPVVIYYFAYRNAMIFGERYTLDDEIDRRSFNMFLWSCINVIPLAPLLLIFADKMGVVSYILIVTMGILTYWKEIFMIILFVMGKYTVKEGTVYFAKKERKFLDLYSGESFSIVYLLDFDDAANRKIPVMVDRYTFRQFKKNGEAILINYRYGESYMFEIIMMNNKSSQS